ncbi:MAG: dihydrodipicolinate synthase family protein [Acidobacteriaceae bacterium]|nr:dihydrodipicolinate synthase family protein [Acidobacteriaceae bacterium]
MAHGPKLDPEAARLIANGMVIPAHPLALTAQRKLDERRQVGLTRYYCDAGAGGIAVAVHTTQFAIRDPKFALFEPVLRLAASTVRQFQSSSGKRVLLIAGICGETPQALREARLAGDLGFDLGLLSLASLRDATDCELIAHCRAVGEAIPLFGFYLQPAVGGRVLGYEFWRRFCDIDSVAAIKVAPFNRYQTVDVLRAAGDSGRGSEIALYTGNDDNIIPDLLSDFDVNGRTMRFAGGLLGQWSVWTRRAVELLENIRSCREKNGASALDILARSGALTDANAALFDAKNSFAGCIAGLHEILRRQGLLAGRWCLDEQEDLSPGQMQEIERVCASYPALQDDEFVAAHLDRWLA